MTIADIAQAKENKQILEKDIRALIYQYEQTHNMSVDCIDLVKSHTIGCPNGQIVAVKVRVVL